MIWSLVSSTTRRRFAAIAVFACATAFAHALTWETTTRELTVEIGASDVVVEFPYKNETDAPVRITDIKSGCDCSATDLPEAPIPPGGKGVLAVRFKPGSEPGVRTVPIEVATDGPDAAVTTLSIKATLEAVLKADRVLVRWAKGDPTDAKQVTIAGTGRARINSMKLVPPAKTVTASLAPGDVAGKWILSLAPVSTDNTLTVRVEVEAEVRDKTIKQAVYVVVR